MTTTDLTTYTLPDPQNGRGLLNVGPAGRTFLACRGIAGGLLPDESPVVVDRAAMLLWSALATHEEVVEMAAHGAFSWPGDEDEAPVAPPARRADECRVCGDILRPAKKAKRSDTCPRCREDERRGAGFSVQSLGS
jgi:hypothetical protein